MPTVVNCDFCGEPTQKSPSTLERNKHNFCSKRCAGLFRRKRKVVNCANCGEALERHYYRIDKNENHFCDYNCEGEWLEENGAGSNAPNWRGGPISVSCTACGKDVERHPSQFQSERCFCSPECRYKWQGDFLSGENSGMWRGGKYRGYRGPNWHKQRRRARKRDNYTCQNCDITEKKTGQEHDVHHIVPFRRFDYVPGENDNYKEANKLSNLVTLCHSCHMSAEVGNIPVQPSLL